MTGEGYDYIRAFCLSGTLNYTRYFFKARFGRKFVVNDHHVKICQALDDVIDGKIKKLIINIAPRYSKTELVVKNFISYGLAINPSAKFLHLSYSDDLANDNSEEVRDIVKSEEYKRVFPYVDIKRTSDAKKKWYTTEGGGMYATAAGGQVTGFGAGAVDDKDDLSKALEEFKPSPRFAGALIIDDPVKPEDAISDTPREKVNQRFETTIRNRVNSRNTPIIIIMQRLHEHDLCGYLMENEPGEWTVLSLPAIVYENGEKKALWEFKHTLEELHRMQKVNSYVFETQYMQNPTPMEGLMYGKFKTYETIPITNRAIRKNYTDTADTGSDYLCSIDYVDTEIGNFILDVLFTQKEMEFTEPETAKMLTKDQISKANIESNNGGRGFARNIEKQMRMIGNPKTQVSWFHQSKNKEVRIFTRSSEVMNLTYFPTDWERRWPEFASQLKTYRKKGKNAHDDACFAAGTKIATVNGWKSIEHIKEGDRVITPFGIRRVLASGCTGEKDVMTRFGITATADHKIFYNSSFCPLSKCSNYAELNLLTLKELIKWRLKKLLYLTEKNTVLWGRESITLASQKAMKEGGTLKGFMSLFGNIITEGKFRKVFVFIIKTITHLITILAIWSVFQLTNTYQNMLKKILKIKNLESGIKRISIWQDLKRLYGIRVKMGESGIQNTQKGKRKRISNVFARIAASLSLQHIETLCFVPKLAEANIEQNKLNTHPFVCNAEKTFITIKPNQASQIANSAVFHAQQLTTTPIGKVRVYNLKVEKDGCYFANGILVSNCDALTGTVEMRGEIDVLYYNKEEIGTDNQVFVEIHPNINGLFIMVSYCVVDKKIFLLDCLFSDSLIPIDSLINKIDGNVQMEIPLEMKHYADDYRKLIDYNLWVREEITDKKSMIESYQSIIKNIRFPEADNSFFAIIANMSDYDGINSFEAMYVLSCICSRVKSSSMI